MRSFTEYNELPELSHQDAGPSVWACNQPQDSLSYSQWTGNTFTPPKIQHLFHHSTWGQFLCFVWPSQVLRKPPRRFTPGGTGTAFQECRHTALTQGLSELHQGSPWHSWFLAICSACHTCQPLLHIFVCLCFGPGCPLHFLNATSEAKLEQNFSNAVGKSHLLPSCTLQT